MITDLFVAASGLDPGTVALAIPPACRREPSPAAVVAAADGELILELPEWRPRVGSRHLVPALSMLTDISYIARFEVSGWIEGTWTPWVASATIGPGGFAPLPAEAGGLSCDTDVYTAVTPIERIRLRIRAGAADVRALAAVPWLVTLSACDLSPSATETTAVQAAPLAVPALSQLEAPPDIALRICSPASVAMVLGYWDAPAAIVPLAADIFHAETDRYGVWPAAIRAAGRRGVGGYLLRFPDWATAAWCLHQGLPIIASVRYSAGELRGAPLEATTGHLIVLTGCGGDHVSVNDPVAPTAAEVPRRYSLEELKRVWLARTGVGYVLFRPNRPRPPQSPPRAGAQR